MVNKNTLGRALLALALAPVMAACTAAPASSPSASVAPTPTQTAPTLSPAEQDLAIAKQAVTNLWSVVDRLTNDPQASLQDLDTVASGEALEFFRKNLTGYRLEQLTWSGSSVVELQSAQPSGNNSQGLPTWTVTACVDTSDTKLVDPSGKNVVNGQWDFPVGGHVISS